MVDRIETDVSPFKPGGRFVRMDGTLTDDAYRFLDQIWKRSGGFSDGAYDQTGQISALESQVGELSRSLEAIQFDLARTSEVSESALRQALNIEEKNVVTAGIKTRNLARNAASVIASATDAVSSDITSGTGTAKRTNSIAVTLSVDVGPEVEPGSDIAVLVDFEHVIETAAFNWVVMSQKMERYDIGNPSGNLTNLRTSLWVQGGDAGNVASLPNSILGNDLSFPHNWIYVNTLPEKGDAAYSANGYTYRSTIEVSNAWDDGSTMIDGYDTPNTNSSSHRIEDWQILVFQLKR